MEQKTTIVSGIASISTAVVSEVLGWSAVVLFVSMLGWAVSSLHTLAGWTDDAPIVAKLEIIKGVFASVAAAAIFVLIGNWQEWPTLLNIVGAFLAGMSGDRLLRPLADGMIARLGAAVDAMFGRGPTK